EAGFGSAWVSQHFLAKPYQALQTWPLLGRLAAESGDMTIGSSIFLLTLSNPAYAAEQAATMDVMTGGRFVFGVGLGYREEEFEAFGVDSSTRGSRFEECLDVAIRLWTEDEVTHAGRHFRLTNASLLLKPVQEPYPEQKYRSYAQWGLDRPMGEAESLSIPFEDLLKDRFIVGTPQECSEEIERYRDALGVNHLLLRLQWPGMPHQDVLREIELIGDTVIPMWRT